MPRFSLWLVWSLTAIAATAGAVPVKSQQITFSSGAETIAGYLAVPESPGKHPALVVLHEDAGLTAWVREQTRKLAAQGYVALAVDLYRGQTAFDPYLAYDLMAATPPDRALQDMEAALHLLTARPDVNQENLGSIGWSMGGKWSLVLAENEPRLGACVLNYGALPADPAEILKIHAPVLGIFGADDQTISPGDVEAFESAMEHAHKTVEIKVYPGAGRGFENAENKLGYREGAADDAWQRTIAFLNQYLK